VDRLKEMIAASAKDGPAGLAGKVLASAQAFGLQIDDQSILILGRLWTRSGLADSPPFR
jgi:hypothetical protein